MKKIFFAVHFFCFVSAAFAQEPAYWSYSAIKTGDKVFEIHMTVSLENGWHVYSQAQPASAVAVPTKINFTKNPLVTLEGRIREEGKMEKWSDAATGISANQYADKVDFIQTIKLKAVAKTALTGTHTYQVCTGTMCLPPKTISFSIPIN
jgi:DsbC/DsbD-like thiol-disulfide interchange protein